ncbi:MAG: hypothetical protein AAGU05_02550, partial [Anaerolineaceae bacterium]
MGAARLTGRTKEVQGKDMSASPGIIRNIDNQLRMVRSSRADSERLADFYSRIFTKPDGSPSQEFFPYVEDLLNG